MKTVHTRDTMNTIYLNSVNIRQEVFVNEQGVPNNIEMDKDEAACIHFVMYIDTNEAVATCRLLPSEGTKIKLQRMAVRKKFRGQDFGRLLISEAESFAKQQGYRCIHLGAQTPALGFYEKIGYTIAGPKYVEANIEHYPMNKNL